MPACFGAGCGTALSRAFLPQRSMCAISSLVCSDLLALDQIFAATRQRLQQLSQGSPGPVANRAMKVSPGVSLCPLPGAGGSWGLACPSSGTPRAGEGSVRVPEGWELWSGKPGGGMLPPRVMRLVPGRRHWGWSPGQFLCLGEGAGSEPPSQCCSHSTCPALLLPAPAAVRGSLQGPALPEGHTPALGPLHPHCGHCPVHQGPADGCVPPSRREPPPCPERNPTPCACSGPWPGAGAGSGAPQATQCHGASLAPRRGGGRPAGRECDRCHWTLPQPVPVRWHGAGGPAQCGALPGLSASRATDTVPAPGQMDRHRGQPGAVGLRLPQCVAAAGGSALPPPRASSAMAPQGKVKEQPHVPLLMGLRAGGLQGPGLW